MQPNYLLSSIGNVLKTIRMYELEQVLKRPAKEGHRHLQRTRNSFEWRDQTSNYLLGREQGGKPRFPFLAMLFFG